MLSPGIVLQQRYRIKRMLARGGMGAVYEAEDGRLRNAAVAVKETFFDEDQKTLREQFEREAATLARLRHPALPQVKDHFIEGGGQFLVMDFIEGDDLGALLERRLNEKGEPFEFWQVMEWADRLLDALDYIHSQYPPVIHRDIKPQNLKLTPRGELFLIDFGLAKGGATTTHPGHSVHAYTLEFAPPEQIKGEGTDARSDFYSLGASLYLLATGKLPPDARVREEAMAHLMPDLLKPAHHVNRWIPFAFAAALAKAMALDRGQRYQSALEMRDALRQIKQTFEAENAGRERLEAEHQRLKDEERKRPEKESYQREEERKRLEDESRQREIERRRQIEEAAMTRALQEELRTKEEDLAKLKRASPREAVTLPIVRQPDEAVTEPIVRRSGADELRIGQKEERKREEEQKRREEMDAQQRLRSEEDQLRREEEGSHKTQSVPYGWFLIAGVALAIAIVVAYVFWPRQTTPERAMRTTLTPPPAPLGTFSFETVTLDKKGRETSRKTGQARYFAVELGNGVTLEMIEIPGGSFKMGGRYDTEVPQHLVNVPSFWMGKFEVTQAQWKAVMGGNPLNFKGDDLPVESLSWNGAQEFLTALNRKLGLQNKGRQYQYRLPSEAEWEYAARAGTDTPFAFGETITSQIVNYNVDYLYDPEPKGISRGKPVAVGNLGVANAFGLFDMHGNVYEWCEDVYTDGYNGAPTDGSAWLSGGDLSSRVLRGGSWSSDRRDCRSGSRAEGSTRSSNPTDSRYVVTISHNRYGVSYVRPDNSCGFRVVVSARTL